MTRDIFCDNPAAEQSIIETAQRLAGRMGGKFVPIEPMPADNNMQLEDMLTILGRVGTVTLRKGTNDRSATPGFTANTEGWTCTVQLAGYVNSGGIRSVIGNTYDRPQLGLTMKQAAAQCLSDLEAYISGPKGKDDRDRYIQNRETQIFLKTKDPRYDGDHSHLPFYPEAKIKWNDD